MKNSFKILMANQAMALVDIFSELEECIDTNDINITTSLPIKIKQAKLILRQTPNIIRYFDNNSIKTAYNVNAAAADIIKQIEIATPPQILYARGNKLMRDTINIRTDNNAVTPPVSNTQAQLQAATPILVSYKNSRNDIALNTNLDDPECYLCRIS